jgi:hypothetical protein
VFKVSEKLSINSELFEKMRDQFDTMLNSIVMLLEAGDEGELTLKVGVDKKFLLNELDEDGNEVERKKVDVEWKLERIIKAKKYKLEGRNFSDFFLEEDDEGLKLNKVEQVTLFDGSGNKIAGV